MIIHKLKAGCILALLSLALVAKAQKSDYTFMERNHFSYPRYAILSEAGYTPAFTNDLGFQKSWAYFTFLSYTYENRINIANKKDWASLSFSVPAKIALNVVDEVLPTAGLGFYLDANIFKNSTYNNISVQGWQFSLGSDMDFALGVPVVNGPAVWRTFSHNLRITYTANDFDNDEDIMFMLKLGIPQSFTDESGDQGWANLKAGFYFLIPLRLLK